MKIILITKNYPPQLGGMEKYSFNLFTSLKNQDHKVVLIKSQVRNEELLQKKGTKKNFSEFFFSIIYILSELSRLFLFTIKTIFYGFYHSLDADIIWLLDGSIAPLGLFLGFFTGTKTRITLHGTDVVWGNPVYQFLMPKIISQLDEIYIVSANTMSEAIKRGIPKNKIQLIPHENKSFSFVDIPEFDRNNFLLSLGITNPVEKNILFSIGRWIERKGFHWFLSDILPNLNPYEFHYVLAGFGPYESYYKEIIRKKNIKNITLLGKIDDITKAKIFLSSNLFVMPNISVTGDVEGFGLVLLEAKHYHLPILATDADNLKNLSSSDFESGITISNQHDFLSNIKLLCDFL